MYLSQFGSAESYLERYHWKTRRKGRSISSPFPALSPSPGLCSVFSVFDFLQLLPFMPACIVGSQDTLFSLYFSIPNHSVIFSSLLVFIYLSIYFALSLLQPSTANSGPSGTLTDIETDGTSVREYVRNNLYILL